jgi:microcystin-dependent protein
MSFNYVGEIKMFAGFFAPNGWLDCDGALYAIADFETLFQLIGTTYGGDGTSTFAVPDLRGRVPVHMGTGQNGATYVIGELGGTESVNITAQSMPVHGHPLAASTAGGTSTSAETNVPAANNSPRLYLTTPTDTQLAGTALGPAGGSQPHENRMPFLTVRYIIAHQGVFPSAT